MDLDNTSSISGKLYLAMDKKYSILSKISEGKFGEVYNIGNNKPIKLMKYIKQIELNLKKKVIH